MKKTFNAVLAMFLVIAALVFAGVSMGRASRKLENFVYPIEYEKEITAAAEKYGVPPSVIFAVIKQESGFNPDAESYIGARGLMQLTRDTYDWMNLYCGKDAESFDCLYEAETNLDYGVWLLNYLYEKFGCWETVYAAYHAGMNVVAKWLKDPEYSEDGVNLISIPYEDTADYVAKVSANRKGYLTVYDFD